MQSRVFGSLIALVLLAAGFMYANMQKGDESVDMHGEILLQLETLPDYSTHGSLYNGWLDQHHETAFSDNYTIERRGGRRGRTVTSFNDVAYLDDLFRAMVTSAAAAGYPEQAEHLRNLREELTITTEE